MGSKKYILLSLALPILILLGFVIYHQNIANVGKEAILPISGYDPRDLLSGHYLIYHIDYDIPDICRTSEKQVGYVCLSPKGFFFRQPHNCQILIRGTCNYYRFTAGIERYYIPEDKADYLSKLIRDKKTSIVISVKNGVAQVKDLLIDGQSWHTWRNLAQ